MTNPKTILFRLSPLCSFSQLSHSFAFLLFSLLLSTTLSYIFSFPFFTFSFAFLNLSIIFIASFTRSFRSLFLTLHSTYLFSYIHSIVPFILPTLFIPFLSLLHSFPIKHLLIHFPRIFSHITYHQILLFHLLLTYHPFLHVSPSKHSRYPHPLRSLSITLSPHHITKPSL